MASVQAAGVVVIVNKANTNSVDKSIIQKIYTGKINSWPNGDPILAIDLPESSSVRASFTSSVIGKTIGNMRALWAKIIFTGSGAPLKIVGSDAEVKRIVAGNPNAIGYISASSLDGSVKAVLK